MHGCGNDFLVIDSRLQQFIPNKDLVVKLADYKKSIGFDQLMLIENSSSSDISLKIFNRDGTIAAACGNGSRCVSKLILEETGKEKIFIEVSGRSLEARYVNGLVSINMGKAELLNNQANHDDITFGIVNIGNLHLVVQAYDLFEQYGLMLCNHYKANINFVEVLNKDNVNLKTWENGVGATLACGTGACASFYYLYKNGLINKIAKIKQPGGDVYVSLEGDEIILSGDAQISYRGSFE